MATYHPSVTTASCERSFPIMRRIKTFFRNYVRTDNGAIAPIGVTLDPFSFWQSLHR